MSFFSKLFGRHKKEESKTGGVEDFLTLIRVYLQAALAGKLGITNLNVLPDLRVFKQTLHVPTVNNRLGLGEKNRCKKMLSEIYEMPETFFKEVDDSIKKNCRTVRDVQGFLLLFQSYTQDSMMLLSNMLGVKLRIPARFKGTLREVIAEGVERMLTSDKWKDAGQRKTAYELRTVHKRLGFSTAWLADYAFRIILLAKKEPKPKDAKVEEKK